MNGGTAIQALVDRFRQELANEPLLTYREMAQQAGVSERAMYSWLHDGVTPKKNSLRKIHAWLEQREQAAA